MDKIELIGIARHRISIDGSGVTSLVCTKRCPLSCEYCVNKEQMLDETHVMNLDEESLYNKLKIDNLYFQATHGGVTFGGGEPLIYADFICDFSKKYKGSWKIGLETSLNVPQNQLEKVIPYIDEYIIDIKDMNPEIYLRYTGMKNEQVIQNLKLLIERLGGKNLYVRVPLIPEYNTELDRNYSEEVLKEMGIKHIEKFFYSIP